MNCIAIDDEPRALDVIEEYSSKISLLTLEKSFSNSLKAVEYLQKNKIDLIFLDIEMPNLSGMDLLKTLEYQPMIIFTTAYSEFAVDSFDFNVIDYLLKPIDFNRFLKSVNKAFRQYSLVNSDIKETIQDTDNTKDESFILVKSGTKIHRLIKKDILYIQSYGNYVYFFTNTERIISIFTMKEVLSLLSDDNFIRIHKSYIINLNQVDLIEKHQVTIGDFKIPIGYSYREHFLSKINS